MNHDEREKAGKELTHAMNGGDKVPDLLRVAGVGGCARYDDGGGRELFLWSVRKKKKKKRWHLRWNKGDEK